jgi:cytochrome P450
MKVIRERRTALEAKCQEEQFESITDLLESTEEKLDFLDILLTCKGADGQPLPYQEILDEVNTFMVGLHTRSVCGYISTTLTGYA